MNDKQLSQHLRELCPEENEHYEWKEFKSLKHAISGKKGEDLVSYVSAFANMEGGYLILGIADKTFQIVGIDDFHDYTPENICQRILGKCPNLDSENFSVQEFITSDTGKTVWLFNVPVHQPRLPVYAHDKAWQRVGDSLTPMRTERLESILSESIAEMDWSSEIIDDATLEDLDPEAINKAREKFIAKNQHKSFAQDIHNWDDLTLLDKAKITIRGKITRTALLLLGKNEASHLLLPNPAQITWKLETEEQAYEHFSPPFLLSTSELLQCVRNIRYKIFPDNYLLAAEVNKYDTRVILEALHNCIAHQDYTANARIVVIEKIDRLLFENSGNFFDGKPEDYFSGERTPRRYRNPWLAQAMVNLDMIDTVGHGIHAMLLAQRRRFFPLPDYSKSQSNQVVLEIYGHLIDENYTKLLLEDQNLSITTVIGLDRVQKKQSITDTAATALRRQGLIEGRKPNYYVSARVAAATKTETNHTRSRGLAKPQLKEFVLQHLRQFGATSRSKLEELLFDMLPTSLTAEKKKNKVKNLLTEMRAQDHSVKSVRKGNDHKWTLTSKN